MWTEFASHYLTYVDTAYEDLPSWFRESPIYDSGTQLVGTVVADSPGGRCKHYWRAWWGPPERPHATGNPGGHRLDWLCWQP